MKNSEVKFRKEKKNKKVEPEMKFIFRKMGNK